MRKTSLVFTFLFLNVVLVFSQPNIANYTTTRTTGNTYNSISSSGNAFDSWRYTGGLSQDDNRSDFTDIGFDFWYTGIRYTQFSVSTNGYIDFSNSTADGNGTGAFGYVNSAFSSSTIPAITAFYDDLTAQGGTGALGNSIKYLVTGAAPNRILTVEWINMAVYGNTSPSLNYQVKLYETTGIIEMNYGTMTQGTAGFSYTMGINATAAARKVLQTVNTNTFIAGTSDALATMPNAGSRYLFTPPTPTVAAGTLTFSAVTATSMTLNWPNWATNEAGYVIYNSTDGTNYSFVSQTAVNTTNSNVTGLLPGTTYFWRLYAVTEGRLSSPLSGTRATLAGGNVFSIASGLWTAGGTWNTGVAPTASDSVTIRSTHTVTINTAATCNKITIGNGAAAQLRFANDATARTLTVNSNIFVANGASFTVNMLFTATHTLTVKGNIVNNGIINLAPDGNSLCNTVFSKNGNQTISGTGATTTFNNITLNLGTSINNTLDITTPTFVAPNNFLTLTNGTFKLSTTGASNLTPYTAAITIPQKGGIWLNSAASTINFGATTTIYGNLTTSAGTMNIGNAAEDLLSNGGLLTISGGTMNIAGKYYAVGINNLSKFSLSGGTVIVPSSGSTSATIAPFQITGAGSQFNMTGGTLIIPREGGTGVQNLGFVNTGTSGGTVTAGTLQIGNGSTPAGQTMLINSTYAVGNLTVNSANATAQLLTNPLTVINNVTINSGVLNSNNLNMNVGGNWTNNNATFTPGTATVTFNGTAAQAINGTSASQTFNNFIIAKTVGTTLSSSGSTTTITTNNLTQTSGNFNAPATLNITGAATSSLVLTAGTLSAGANIFIRGNWTNNGGTFSPNTGTVTFNGTAAQAINGTATSQTFNNFTIAKTAGTTLSSGGSTTTITTNNLTQTTGNFTAPATLNVTAAASSSILLSAGTFTSGAQINVNGSWTNTGATFTPGSGTVNFIGTSAQNISRTGGETFNHIAFTNTGIKTLNSAITALGNFTINTNSNLDVNTTNNQITIRGNFSNSGTLTTRNGNIFLNGTTNQSIGGTSTTNFYDLTLNNNAGATLANAENIIGALILNNGTFTTTGQTLTLVSTATGTGRIAAITGSGDIIGNVTAQRFMPGGTTGWAFLGSPINSALTYANWDDDIPISCPTCPDGNAGGFESIYTYDETAPGLMDDDASYIVINTINDPITPDKGYWVYLGDGFSTTNNLTFDLSGTVQKNNHTISLDYTNTGQPTEDGWNLISNPYPSPIRWSLLRGATPNIDNGVYIYNADLNGGSGGYATYVNGISSPAVGAGGIGDTIPMSQGFYVHSTGATALNGSESIKVGGNPTFLRQINNYTPQTTPQAILRLKLTNAGLTHNDETVLYLQNGATPGFENEFDVFKLAGVDPAAPTIALIHDTLDFQINGVDLSSSNLSIPVRVLTGTTGSYTISEENINSFPQGACINLYDTYNGNTTDLRNNSYTFTLSDTTISARFILTITMNPLQVATNVVEATCENPNGAQIIANGLNAGPWNYYWYDSNAQLIASHLNINGADTLNNISSGNYSLSINTVGMCDNNTIDFNLNSVEIPTSSFICQDTIIINSNSLSITNNSTNAVNYFWNFGDGNTSSSFEPTNNYFSAGTFTLSLVTESVNGCIDSAIKSIVVIDNSIGLNNLLGTKSESLKTLSNNTFIFEQNFLESKLTNYSIIDVNGKLVKELGTFNNKHVSINIDLSNASSGIYYLIIKQNNLLKPIKLLVN
ncbi:MAG: fibronectin type III domain-containing protein [Bacteroidetes bacterium]|nr:fibronectin type III domain-containing protein [Bacteroidota bacterium]